MKKTKLFTIDGVDYNVDVTKLTRKFSVLDTEKSGRTLNGEMYRDPIGTFYNYTMSVRGKSEDPASLDAFWEVISKPSASYVCTFPYGQDVLSQRMYVTSGEQNLKLISEGSVYWGEITLNFIAMEPKVKV